MTIKIYFWLLSFINVLVIKIYFVSFDISCYLPIVVSLIICVIAYLNFELLGEKKTISWYFILFLQSAIFLSLISYLLNIFFEIFMNKFPDAFVIIIGSILLYIQGIPMGAPNGYILLSNYPNNTPIPTGGPSGSAGGAGGFSGGAGGFSGGAGGFSGGAGGSTIQPIGRSTIPLGATQTYDHRNLHCVLSLNYYNPKEWTIVERLRLVENLERQFFKYSLNSMSKAEVAMFKDVLKDNNVQASWVAFNTSNTNKPPLYESFHNNSYKQMVIAKKESLIQQSKFLATPNKSILN